MFVLSARKKRERKSEKPQTEFIRQKPPLAIQETKMLLAHKHTGTPPLPHLPTPPPSTPKDEHIIHILTHVYSWRQIQSITAASKPNSYPILLTHRVTHMRTTTSTFVSSAAQQALGCRSINIDSHFDSTYSFIYLLIHSLIHFTSKTCQLLWLKFSNWLTHEGVFFSFHTLDTKMRAKFLLFVM